MIESYNVSIEITKKKRPYYVAKPIMQTKIKNKTFFKVTLAVVAHVCDLLLAQTQTAASPHMLKNPRDNKQTKN